MQPSNAIKTAPLQRTATASYNLLFQSLSLLCTIMQQLPVLLLWGGGFSRVVRDWNG
jgi:hypothetical protein